MTREIALEIPCDVAIQRVNTILDAANFGVVQSFDLQSARALIPDCPCPHHGTELCNCQYAVLLVYEGGGTPLTLVIHGHDNDSWIVPADNPAHPVNAEFQTTVIRMLLPERLAKSHKGE